MIRKILSSILFITSIGFFCLAGYSFYETYFVTNNNTEKNIQVWEEIYETERVQIPEEETKVIEEIDEESEAVKEEPEIIVPEYNEGDLLGTIQFSNSNKIIPLKYGHTNEMLDEGVGCVEDRILSVPGRENNSVIYGHREEVFWDLKDIQIGDEVYIEMREGYMTFKVYEIQILNPKDIYIYEETDESIITLVTCYPFIYMGRVEARYVVKAELVSIE